MKENIIKINKKKKQKIIDEQQQQRQQQQSVEFATFLRNSSRAERKREKESNGRVSE